MPNDDNTDTAPATQETGISEPIAFEEVPATGDSAPTNGSDDAVIAEEVTNDNTPPAETVAPYEEAVVTEETPDDDVPPPADTIVVEAEADTPIIAARNSKNRHGRK